MAAYHLARLLLPVTLAVSAAADQPRVHLDILVNDFKFERLSGSDVAELKGALTRYIANSVGRVTQDIYSLDNPPRESSVSFVRGTQVFPWLPHNWPARTGQGFDGSGTVIACIIYLPEASTLPMVESALHGVNFGEGVADTIKSAPIQSSNAITGTAVGVLDVYVGPVEGGIAGVTDPEVGGDDVHKRMPWSAGLHKPSGNFPWSIVIGSVVAVLLVVGVAVFVALTLRRRNKRGHDRFLEGRRQETWRDKFIDISSKVWKTPPGGYGVTGH